MANIPELTEDEWLKLTKRLTLHAHCKLVRLTWRGVRSGSPPGGIGAEDLAAQAIVDVIEGKRRWNQQSDPDFLKYLKSVVDSIISKLVNTVENRQTRHVGRSEPSEEASAAYEVACPDPDPAELVVNRDAAIKFRAVIVKALEGDELAYQVMECLEAEMTPAEIAEYLVKPITEINNAQKRLRRRVENVLNTQSKGKPHG